MKMFMLASADNSLTRIFLILVFACVVKAENTEWFLTYDGKYFLDSLDNIRVEARQHRQLSHEIEEKIAELKICLGEKKGKGAQCSDLSSRIKLLVEKHIEKTKRITAMIQALPDQSNSRVLKDLSKLYSDDQNHMDLIGQGANSLSQRQAFHYPMSYVVGDLENYDKRRFEIEKIDSCRDAPRKVSRGMNLYSFGIQEGIKNQDIYLLNKGARGLDYLRSVIRAVRAQCPEQAVETQNLDSQITAHLRKAKGANSEKLKNASCARLKERAASALPEPCTAMPLSEDFEFWLHSNSRRAK